MPEQLKFGEFPPGCVSDTYNVADWADGIDNEDTLEENKLNTF